MRIVELTIKAKVRFHGYSSEKSNSEAEKQIKRWIKESLENDCSYIPMRVEKDKDFGGFHEDCTSKVQYQIY